jgi:serine/threonine protein kinase
MTQHGADPSSGRARDSSDDGTRVEANPSGDGDVGPPSHSGSGSLSPRRDALFGQVLADRYRVLDLIGKGGMGKVYLAEHIALGKRVAVKVLNPAYTHRPDQVKRFLREARAASKIGHENVIDVIDYGEMPNGSVFFVMEHLQGEDLGKLLRRTGSLPWSRARRILLQICRAVQAAHAKGILHRDMKPENCFIIHRNGMRDFVKVLDFGIAKMHEENNRVSHTLTQAGALIGTPEYMAPEQVQGEAGDARIDIYALGCIMYQLLTGQLPFSDKTMFGVLSQQVNVRPVPPRQLSPDADIPVEVEAIILKAMEKDRNLRFQTMAELIEGIVAAPRGLADGRSGTTSNLDAAASAARIAAAMNAASAQALAAASSTNTPQDVSFPTSPTGPISTSNVANQLASQTSPSAWSLARRRPRPAAAHQAGHRPARRCLPAASSAWSARSTAAAARPAEGASAGVGWLKRRTPPSRSSRSRWCRQRPTLCRPRRPPSRWNRSDPRHHRRRRPRGRRSRRTRRKDQGATPKVKKDPGARKDPAPKKDPKVAASAHAREARPLRSAPRARKRRHVEGRRGCRATAPAPRGTKAERQGEGRGRHRPSARGRPPPTALQPLVASPRSSRRRSSSRASSRRIAGVQASVVPDV